MGGAALGPRYGGELSLGVLDLPTSWEPRAPGGQAESLLLSLIHETLLSVGPEGLPSPGLAQSWGATASGQEWTLTLQEGLFFHDGKPLTSEDALRSLRRFLRAPSAAAVHLAQSLDGGASFRAGSTEDLPGIAERPPSRLILRFREPTARPLAPLASLAAAVTSARGAGTGPFVPNSPVAARGLSLTAFAGHVRGRPYLDRVQLLAFREPESLDQEFQGGRIGLTLGSQAGSVVRATLLLVLDPDQAPFEDAATRGVVAAAIDRRGLVKHLIPGAEPTSCLLPQALLPGLGQEDRAESPSPHGVKRGTVSMKVSREVPRLVSQRIVAHLNQVGFDVDAQPADWASLLRPAAAQVRLLLWSPEVAEAGLALEELSAFGQPQPDVQGALAAASRERDFDRRRGHLHRAEAALRSEQVLLPLASVAIPVRWRRGIHGIRIDATGRVVLEDAWLEP